MTDIYEIRTKAPGPSGTLPVTEDLLLRRPSGDLFGMTRTPAWAGIPRSWAGSRS
jgi:hypothetical protein